MEQLDVLLLLTRTIAMTFFLVEALHLFAYARNSHIFRVYGMIQLGMGALYALTVYSSYFSEAPLLYSGQLNLLWNLMIPAVIIMCNDLLTGRKTKKRYILAHFLPFIFAFLFYSVNMNNDILRAIGWLSFAYTTIAMVVLEVMTVKVIKRHTERREKHAYIWFSVLMWAMYLSLVIRFLLVSQDLRFVKIIVILVLIIIYGTLTLLLRRGLLDFHQLQQEEPDELEPVAVPSRVLPTVVQPRKSLVNDRTTEQPLNMHDQVSFFGEKARQLTDLMETKRLYLKPDLSVASLAMELGTNRTYLSNLINQYLHTTFTNYVNAYRVQYAKNLLLKTDDTIEEIFQAAGFQSRTTFWRAFAQVEGCTPKDYRKKAVKNTPSL